MFFLLVRVLAALLLDAAHRVTGFTIILPARPAPPCVLSKDRSRRKDSLNRLATDRANLGIERAGWAMKRNRRRGGGLARGLCARTRGFQVDFFRRYCVESCDFLRRAWPRWTVGPMRFGDLRAPPETATSSGFPEEHPVGTIGPLSAASGTRARIRQPLGLALGQI